MSCNTGLRWSMGSCAAVLYLLFLHMSGSGLAMTDRKGLEAIPNACSLPGDLGSLKGQPNSLITTSHMRFLYSAFG